MDLPGGGRGDWLSRRDGDAWSVSVFLRNANPPVDGHDQPENCLFQPRLTVHGGSDTSPFLDRTQRAARRSHDPDLESYRLLYRDRPEFAVGHGCAAIWDAADCLPHRARSVGTELIPFSEVAATEARGGAGLAVLSMDTLAEAQGTEELRRVLEPLLVAYAEWIGNQERLAEGLPADLMAKAAEHLGDCRDALGRMREGIDLIASEPPILEAFRFANRAMALQRRRAIRGAARQRGVLGFGGRTHRP